jgi:hypothetical protein
MRILLILSLTIKIFEFPEAVFMMGRFMRLVFIFPDFLILPNEIKLAQRNGILLCMGKGWLPEWRKFYDTFVLEI